MQIRNGLKGLVYRLSYVCHFDIDRGISTAHCRSPSSDSVDLLSRTMFTTLVVSDWCITNLAHSWFGFDQRRKLIPQWSVVLVIGSYVV